MDKETIKAHKISDEEYAQILEILGREPNLLELGVISAMWSEHCSYKSSKKYLNGFPTKAPWVIQGPGENAGVIDIGQGMAAVFKVESHNHPSFIEPFAGAATGVGGILRDVFTMGARVVAGLNSLKFGNIHDEKCGKHQKYLVKGVVNGISHYGNCMGVPTIGGECAFDECFNGNILVNAFALGVCKSEDIFYAKAEGVGNPVIYVGSKTGRDGLGGAVMASDSFNEESKSLRPTVQIGDPFSEKLLMEACLELFKTDYIVGIQDMGAAGLTSSSFEMAGRSGSGMKLYLDKTPIRESGMTPYELMLSESQERMLICAKKGYEDKVIEIFKKWDLDAVVIGEVTNTGKMELFWHDELVGLIPIEPLSEKAPILSRPISEPKYLSEIKDYKFELKLSIQELFIQMLQNENINNKAFIYDQFDSSVQTNTIKAIEKNRLNSAYKNYIEFLNLRKRAVASGYFESLHYVLDNGEELKRLGFDSVKLKLINPITAELNTLRTTLLNHLLNAASLNAKNSKKIIKLFELGAVFNVNNQELNRIAFIHSGLKEEAKISNKAKPESVQFYDFLLDIKNIIGDFKLKSSKYNILSPYEQADIYLSDIKVGFIGRLHLKIENERDLPKTYICELDLDLIRQDFKIAKPYSKFPAITRDLSVLIPKGFEYNQIKNCIEELNLEILENFRLVDIYSDENLKEFYSITISFSFRDINKTLEDNQVNECMDKILNTLKNLGLDLR
ncbi:phosphoribosylformylglycinamidine synthase subunit PurL [Campylobacter jejuni]|uniref:phosphoribosylformylglycinamidine synthase subunit PurL n=5 Tax=Campylobacter TaxID=194 RepID=UPI0011228695|nr:phosphoribosylformylglycinamidine synthase subunit PurL [Campylobacter jejuni]